MLLHCIGEKAREVYNTFAFSSTEDSKKYNKVLGHFEAYIGPRKKFTYSCFKFFAYRQEPGQKFDDYLTEMSKLTSDCDLLELCPSLLIDMLIIGLIDKSLHERLLRESNLDLTKTIDTSRTVELTCSHAHAIQNANPLAELDVNEIRKRSLQHRTQPRNQSSEVINKCKFCLYSHKRESCPAYGKFCNNCKKKGYFSKCCPNFDSKVNFVKVDNCKSLSKGVVGDEENSSLEKEWRIGLLVNQTLISFKIDSISQARIIPKNCVRAFNNKPKLHKPNAKLTAYNGCNIPVEGSCGLNIELKRKTIPVLLILADVNSQPFLGLKTSIQLNLIKRIMNIDKTLDSRLPSYLNEFNDSFGEIGCLRNKHHTVTDDSVTPKVNPPRRIPIALKQ